MINQDRFWENICFHVSKALDLIVQLLSVFTKNILYEFAYCAFNIIASYSHLLLRGDKDYLLWVAFVRCNSPTYYNKNLRTCITYVNHPAITNWTRCRLSIQAQQVSCQHLFLSEFTTRKLFKASSCDRNNDLL